MIEEERRGGGGGPGIAEAIAYHQSVVRFASVLPFVPAVQGQAKLLGLVEVLADVRSKQRRERWLSVHVPLPIRSDQSLTVPRSPRASSGSCPPASCSDSALRDPPAPPADYLMSALFGCQEVDLRRFSKKAKLHERQETSSYGFTCYRAAA